MLLKYKKKCKQILPNCIKCHVGESERKSEVAAKNMSLKEEMELTIKHDSNGKRPSRTIPLTISYGKNINSNLFYITFI